MSEKMDKLSSAPSPDEQKKLEQSRTLHEDNLLYAGAKWVKDAGAKKKRLKLTEDQLANKREENYKVEADMERVRVQLEYRERGEKLVERFKEIIARLKIERGDSIAFKGNRLYDNGRTEKGQYIGAENPSLITGQFNALLESEYAFKLNAVDVEKRGTDFDSKPSKDVHVTEHLPAKSIPLCWIDLDSIKKIEE